ncbi:MAG: hypothetical protein RBS24_02375 [Bacilli bacterium]|nr:hypothetical protein [Bacilli bacterium]
MEKRKLFNVIAAGLLLVAVVLWFALAGVKVDGGDGTYSFLDMTFGKTVTVLGVEVVIFKFSVMNLLTLVLLLLAIVVAILRFLGKGLFKGDGFLLLGLAVVAVVFVILTKQFTVMTNDSVKETFVKDYKLTGGAIAIAVLAGLGGVGGLLGDYIK